MKPEITAINGGITMAQVQQVADGTTVTEVSDTEAVREIWLTWPAERRLLLAAELFRRHVIRRAAAGRLPAVMEELRLDGPE